MIHKRKCAACLLFALASTGSIAKAAAPTDDAPVRACESEYGKKLGSKVFALPSPGIESTAEVGQTMVSNYKTDLMEGTNNYEFSLDQPTKLSGRTYGQDFAITLFPLKIRMVQGLQYRPAEYAFQYANDSSPRTGLSKPDVFLTMTLPSREVVAKVKVGFGEDRIVAGAAALITTPQCTLTGPDSFQKELVYSGVAKGVVTILYREFFGNVAMPAFSQELHFDLSEGNEIGYKGARFKVIKANNLGITYLVTKSLD